MINRDFWAAVSVKWSARTDGIEIPDMRPIDDYLGLDPEVDAAAEELDEILADLDI